MRHLRRLLAWSALPVLTLPVGAEPLTTMDAVGAKILSCWEPPAGVKNSSVSMKFSFKKDGSLIGPPRPAYINISGDEKVRKEFIAAATDAIKRCTPVEFSPDLAQGIGGQVFTLEFGTSDKDQMLFPGG